MANVFISHSAIDKPFVRTLADELRRRRISVWIDEEQIKVGQPIPRRIQDGISCCEYFLLVISQQAVRSRWVEDELNSASFAAIVDACKTILPVLIEDVDVPKQVRHLKCADFGKTFESGLTELLAAFKIDTDEITFLTRSERIATIESLLLATGANGEMPTEIEELVEDESYLPLFEQKLSNTTDRRVLHNSLEALRWLACYPINGKPVRSHTSIQPLIKLHGEVAEPATKQKIVEALAAINSTLSLDFLIHLLKTEPPAIKVAILSEWQDMHEWSDRPQWLHRIIALLHDFTKFPQSECLYFDYEGQEEDFRFWVFRCLGHFKRKQSLRYVEDFLKSTKWPLGPLVEAAAAHWYITGEQTYLSLIRKGARLSIGTGRYTLDQIMRKGKKPRTLKSGLSIHASPSGNAEPK
jgi:hypothetical protein